jgi:ABC-type polar amino acid transport system ATPase subunit
MSDHDRPPEYASPMRLTSVRVENAEPVRLFEARDLADVVVLAGPNGVGKTRLIGAIVNQLRNVGSGAMVQAEVAATTPAEREAWGKSTLDLRDPADRGLLTTTLQASRRRRNWSSSLVNFESDRTIQNLQPLSFTWEMQDPEDEAVSWDSTWGFMRDRFQDTVHSLFRMIEAQKQSIANRAVRLRREGHGTMNLTFRDPMEPFKDVFAMLLAPKELVDPSARDQRLQYRLDGQTLDFASLSSGEREVVNIAFDFLLRRPSDCIVFFDEPELHLHPELSYKLLQTLRSIGDRNQFILSTHSPDVITASLDQSVIFLSPPKTSDGGVPENQALAVSEADETNRALRLLGQSIGIVALGRKIVLIEGDNSSLDKQTYGSIIGNQYPALVLVPSGGKHVIESFDAVNEAVLSRSIWGVDFYMLCDRDSRPPHSGAAEVAAGSGRLRVLGRYHLENYFLDEYVWADAFAALEGEDSWLRDPTRIRAAQREIAQGFVSYAVALAVASRLRLAAGNVDAMAKNCHGKSLEETQALVAERARSESTRINQALDENRVATAVAEMYAEVSKAVEEDAESWKDLVPGKQVLAAFAARAQLKPGRAKSMYLSAARTSDRQPFDEIERIFAAIAA